MSPLRLAPLLVALAACGEEQPPAPAARPEPRDLVVDLAVDAATMRAMAQALTEQCGVRFELAPDVRADAPLRDPYQVHLPRQNLQEHLRDLEEWGFWKVRWVKDRYVISVTDRAAYR